MSSKHYYYPTTSNGRSKLVDRDRVFDKEHDRASRYDSSDHSDTPSLSRASTPSSAFSSPPTPTLSPVMPADPKMRSRHVEFTSPISQSYRRAEADELSVMRAFASHAGHCDSCNHSLTDRPKGAGLCDRGSGLAKDLGTYFYSYDGKPHSNLDRRRGREQVQVEVPVEYAPVKGLFEALHKGLELKRPRPSKPELHQSSYPPSSTRPLNHRRYTMDSYPTQDRRRYLDHEDYDLKPARSDSRRYREPVYRMHGGRYVDTRPSYHEEYADKRRPLTPTTPTTPRTPLSRYSSGLTDSELKRLSQESERRRSRGYSDFKDRYRYDEYPSRQSDRSSRIDDSPPRSSERPSRGSDRSSRLTDLPSRMGERASRPTERISKYTDFPSRSNESSSRSSDRSSRSSELPSRLSDRSSRSSDIPTRLSDRPSRSKDLPPRSSERSSRLHDLPLRTSDRSWRSDDRYSRLPRRSDSFDRYDKRRDDDYRRRSSEGHYHSDDDHRRSRRTSSYLPFSSLWR